MPSLACKLPEERFGVVFSDQGIRNLFDRVSLSYTRSIYTLVKADLQKQEHFRQDFEKLKKLLNNDIARILFEDESMIWDYQAVMKPWLLKGNQGDDTKICQLGKYSSAAGNRSSGPISIN